MGALEFEIPAHPPTGTGTFLRVALSLGSAVAQPPVCVCPRGLAAGSGAAAVPLLPYALQDIGKNPNFPPSGSGYRILCRGAVADSVTRRFTIVILPGQKPINGLGEHTAVHCWQLH